VKSRDLVSVFCMSISSFPISICWIGCVFSILCFGFLYQKSVGYRYMGLCLDLLFWYICLPVWFCANTMLNLLLWLCNIVWSQVLWCLQYWTFCSELPWLLKVFLCFHVYFKIDFSISVQNVTGILIGIAFNIYIAFGSMVIFTVLILLIHKHGRSFHLLMSSLISLFSDL
jgi:hypothetical protein